MAKAAQAGVIVLESLTGGMNNTKSPNALPDDQCVLAENVEFFYSDLGERRLGCEAADTTGYPLGDDDVIVHLGPHLPKLAELVDTELWSVSAALEDTATVAHRVGSTWTIEVPRDAIIATTPEVLRIRSASIHGKWFVLYKSAVDRAHVWDGTSIRRTGLAQPDATSVVDSGVGGALTGDRTYRVRFITIVDGDIIRRSEPTDEVTITPSGVNDGVVISRPPLLNEGETNWEIEASSGDGNFYVIATQPLTALTYTDRTVLPIDFANGTLSEDVGDYENIPSAKFAVADQDRLIFGGSWEDPEKDSRIMWTPVWAAPGVGNDERIPVDTDNFMDLDWMVGGGLTGLSEPVNGSFYAFKHNRIYKVQRTGAVAAAYEAYLLSATRGAIIGSVVNGADELGRGCVYFLDPQAGPARVGSGGLQFMNGLRDTWKHFNSNADMVSAHGVYYPDKQQVHWWIATDDHHTPNLKIISQIDEIRSDADGTERGWIIATGAISEAWCSCIIPELMSDPEAGTAILTYRIYAGFDSPFFIQRCDIGDTDNGVEYRAIIRTKPYIPGGLLNKWGASASALLADALDDPSITIDIKFIRDYGIETTKVSTDFSPEGAETQVIKIFDNSKMSNAAAIQIEFSDPPLVSDHCE